MPTLSAQECAGVRAGDTVGCCAPAANASRLTVARVIAAALRLFPKPALGAHAWKVINALLACRTPLLGAHRHHCADCGKDHLVPHSCRNRHCPGCQAALSHDWLERQMQCLLPVTYFHVVLIRSPPPAPSPFRCAPGLLLRRSLSRGYRRRSAHAAAQPQCAHRAEPAGIA